MMQGSRFVYNPPNNNIGGSNTAGSASNNNNCGASSESRSSSPSKRHSFSDITILYIESTKFTNKEFRNARNYYNLYDHNINPKWKDIKDKERLGIRRVNNLPPLVNGQETR